MRWRLASRKVLFLFTLYFVARFFTFLLSLLSSLSILSATHSSYFRQQELNLFCSQQRKIHKMQKYVTKKVRSSINIQRMEHAYMHLMYHHHQVFFIVMQIYIYFFPLNIFDDKQYTKVCIHLSLPRELQCQTFL